MAETKKGRATRDRLLASAAHELVRGHGRVELSAVAKRAGVSPGLPYRYFDSKDDLLAAVADAFFDRFEARIIRPTFAEVSGGWWARERERITRMVAFFYDEPLSSLVIAAMGDRLPKQVRAAARNLRAGQREEAVPKQVDADMAAALIMGGVFQCVATALSAHPRYSKLRLTRTLIQLVANVLEIPSGAGRAP